MESGWSKEHSGWVGGRWGEGRSMDRPAQGGGGTGLWHLGWIQTPGPNPVSLTWATQNCISDFTGAALSSSSVT